MAAIGRINARSAVPGTRILVTADGKGHAFVAKAKVGNDVYAATVKEQLKVDHDANGKPVRSYWYALVTDCGEVVAAPIQTFWLADEVSPVNRATNEANTARLNDKENDMTVTIKKGAGRATAAKRTAKAAQKTPLPERVAPSPSPLKTTLAERTAARAAKKAAALAPSKPEAAKKAPAAVPTAPKPARRRTAKPTGNGIPADFAGATKAQAFTEFTIEAGWAVALETTDGADTIMVQANGPDSQQIVVQWERGIVHAGILPTYTSGGRTVKLRNISAARKVMDGSRTDVKKVPDRGAGRKREAKSGASEKGQVADSGAKRPFDLEDEDQTIVAALRGHAVQWRNRISQAIEEAVVSKTGPVKIQRRPDNGERVVTFNGVTVLDGVELPTGTRSVYLSQVTSVK